MRGLPAIAELVDALSEGPIGGRHVRRLRRLVVARSADDRERLDRVARRTGRGGDDVGAVHRRGGCDLVLGVQAESRLVVKFEKRTG